MTVFTTTPPRLFDDPCLGEHYLRLIGDGDEHGAIEVVTGLLDDGVPAQRIMLDLIARAQGRVGELWAANAWSIAREHSATAISERALAAVAARTAVRPSRGRITVACVDGEWHALPSRILAELLRLDGWRVDFLGANVPGTHLVTHVHQTGPDRRRAAGPRGAGRGAADRPAAGPRPAPRLSVGDRGGRGGRGPAPRVNSARAATPGGVIVAPWSPDTALPALPVRHSSACPARPA